MLTLARGLRAGAYSLLSLLLILVLAGAIGLVVLRGQGQKLFSVQTASMVPAFRPGDALLVKKANVKDLRLGEVISYQSPQDARVIISHRLVSIDPKTGWLTTAGDTLRTADKPFPPNLLTGRATAIAPKLGLVLDFLRHPLGLALAVYIPAILIIAAEIHRLVAHYNNQRYRLSAYR